MLIELANRRCLNSALDPAWSKWVTDYFNFVFSRPTDQRIIEIAKLRAEYNKSPGTRLIELGGVILTRMLQEGDRRKRSAEEVPATEDGQMGLTSQNEGRGQSYLI